VGPSEKSGPDRRNFAGVPKNRGSLCPRHEGIARKQRIQCETQGKGGQRQPPEDRKKVGEASKYGIVHRATQKKPLRGWGRGGISQKNYQAKRGGSDQSVPHTLYARGRKRNLKRR